MVDDGSDASPLTVTESGGDDAVAKVSFSYDSIFPTLAAVGGGFSVGVLGGAMSGQPSAKRIAIRGAITGMKFGTFWVVFSGSTILSSFIRSRLGPLTSTADEADIPPSNRMTGALSILSSTTSSLGDPIDLCAGGMLTGGLFTSTGGGRAAALGAALGGALGLAYSFGGQALAKLDELIDEEEAKTNPRAAAPMQPPVRPLVKPPVQQTITKQEIRPEQEQGTVEPENKSSPLNGTIAALEASLAAWPSEEDAKVVLDARYGKLKQAPRDNAQKK